jgi:hypothetical protein
MKRVSIVGVIVGGVVDIVTTGIFAIPFMIWVMSKHNLFYLPPTQVQAAMAAVIRSDFVLSVLQWLPGLVASILAGYVAAWIAKHDEVVNGAGSAWLCVVSGVYSWLTIKIPIPMYEHLLGFVASPALGMFGGYLRLLQQRSKIKTLEATSG